MSPLSQTSLITPSTFYPSGLSQSPCLSFLSHSANPYWLSILHMVLYISMLLSPYISPSPFSHPRVHRSVLYVCFSIAALKINSSVLFFEVLVQDPCQFLSSIPWLFLIDLLALFIYSFISPFVAYLYCKFLLLLCCSFHISPPLLPSPCVHKSIIYVCFSIAIL